MTQKELNEQVELVKQRAPQTLLRISFNCIQKLRLKKKSKPEIVKYNSVLNLNLKKALQILNKYGIQLSFELVPPDPTYPDLLKKNSLTHGFWFTKDNLPQGSRAVIQVTPEYSISDVPSTVSETGAIPANLYNEMVKEDTYKLRKGIWQTFFLAAVMAVRTNVLAEPQIQACHVSISTPIRLLNQVGAAASGIPPESFLWDYQRKDGQLKFGGEAEPAQEGIQRINTARMLLKKAEALWRTRIIYEKNKVLQLERLQGFKKAGSFEITINGEDMRFKPLEASEEEMFEHILDQLFREEKPLAAIEGKITTGVSNKRRLIKETVSLAEVLIAAVSRSSKTLILKLVGQSSIGGGYTGGLNGVITNIHSVIALDERFWKNPTAKVEVEAPGGKMKMGFWGCFIHELLHSYPIYSVNEYPKQTKETVFVPWITPNIDVPTFTTQQRPAFK